MATILGQIWRTLRTSRMSPRRVFDIQVMLHAHHDALPWRLLVKEEQACAELRASNTLEFMAL